MHIVECSVVSTIQRAGRGGGEERGGKGVGCICIHFIFGFGDKVESGNDQFFFQIFRNI
jgi:hypothetical protein